eukprot:scaffold18833_cov23-Tisochrysis_lutea.AAC.1
MDSKRLALSPVTACAARQALRMLVAQLTQLQELRLCWDDSIEMVDIGPLSHLQQLTRLTVGTGYSRASRLAQ